MKRAEVFKAGSMKTRPVVPEDFIEAEAKSVTMEKISKKQIRTMAEELGLAYDEAQVSFAKKILAYWQKEQ